MMAQSHLTEEKDLQPILARLSSITPAVNFDNEFSQWVRSNAKIAELEVYFEQQFEKFESDVHHGQKMDRKLLRSAYIKTDGLSSDHSQAVIEDEE